MGIFALDPRPLPPPPDPYPLESPSLSNMVGFPLWEKYFRQNMLLRYTIMRKNLPPPDPSAPFGISVALLWREDMDIFGIRNSPFSPRP